MVIDLVKEGKNEEARKYVTSYTNSFAGAAESRWEEMKVTLWGMLGEGFRGIHRIFGFRISFFVSLNPRY